MSRLIVANLDCELAFARLHCPGPHKILPKRVQEILSLASLTLSVFAKPGDSLWTMKSIESRAVEHSELDLVSGELPDLTTFESVLFWGQSHEFQHAIAAPGEATWQDMLWQLHCSPAIAAAANDRRLCQDIRVDESMCLSGTTVLSTMSELDHYIASAPLGRDQAWIAKVPFAASGRQRVKRRGRLLTGEMRVRTERLLTRYGQLIIQPWVPRIADYGTTGIIGAERSQRMIFPPHLLHSDDSGVFRGIQIADREIRSQLDPVFYTALVDTAENVAETLWGVGYRGPFGVDSFVYKDDHDNLRLQSLCEINARLSFGMVARALAETHNSPCYDFTL